MYARVLRKWSLTKFLMYLWVPVIMLLIIWCQNVTSMHLSTNIRTVSPPLLSPYIALDNIYDNDDQLNDHHHINNNNNNNYNINNNNMAPNTYTGNTPIISNYNINKNNNNNNNYNNKNNDPYEVFIKADDTASNASAVANVPNVPKLNSQIFNLNSLTSSANIDILRSSSNIRTSNNNNNNNNIKLIRHIQPNYMLPTTLKDNNNKNNNWQDHDINNNNNFKINKKNRMGTRIYENNNNQRSSILSSSSSKLLQQPQLQHNININNNDQLTMININNKQNDHLLNDKKIITSNINENRNNEQQKQQQQQRDNKRRSRIGFHRRRSMKRKQLQINNYNNNQSTLATTIPDDRSSLLLTSLSRSSSSSAAATISSSSSPSAAGATSSSSLIDNDLNKLMIGRNRRDSRSSSYSPQSLLKQQQQHHHQNNHHQQQQQNQQQLQQQQQQSRNKRPKRYCSARDPAQLAFEAPTVFEGKIISMSPPDRQSNFSVTFEVKDTFKKQIGYVLPHLLRLQFTYRNTTSECDIYREHLRPRGIVTEKLEQGRIYILFVQQIHAGNFTILGQPIKKARRVVEAVTKGVSENYAQPASIRLLTASSTKVNNGEELRIVCKVRGQPPPKVTWFKDDKSINRNRKLYQYIHLKKRSELVVKSFNSTDAGVYECRAKNKVIRKPERKTIQIEAFYSRPVEDTYSSGDECPGNMHLYCLNGGTCQYFREISTTSCVCPEGFDGDRCQEKQLLGLTPRTYEQDQRECDTKFLGSYYC